MNKTLIIRNDQIRGRAKEILDRLPLEPLHEVVIKEHKVNRSLAQNALMWKWLGLIGPDLGYTKDEAHEVYKEKFLINIFLATPDKHQAVSEMWLSIRQLHKEGQGQIARSLERNLAQLVSTTEASVAEMREYLTDIDHHAASLDIRLPRPEEKGLI